ncbi:hypothetical protein SH16_01738 [Aeromonas caviae]|uniref:H-NS histone family protein n=1 Tax=Aeromonas caviae TaxID=648 RepID=UPI000650DE38|nr:H-NS histone family protein [Aeromonas caviae]KLV46253.1 hypothetical protein SH16_01738 [Aeromonas caviae]
MATTTEKQKYALEVLSSRQSIIEFFEAQEIHLDTYEAIAARFKEAWEEHHAKQKQNDIDELIAIMRAKGIDLADLQGLKQHKKKAETTPSEKINIRYVTAAGEVAEATISGRGRIADEEVSTFVTYCKDTKGIKRADLALEAMDLDTFKATFKEFIEQAKAA